MARQMRQQRGMTGLLTSKLSAKTRAPGSRDEPWLGDGIWPVNAAKRQVKPQVFDYDAGSRTPWQELISKIGCPVLLVMADAAARGIVNEERVTDVRRWNSTIQIIHISGAGYNIRRE